MSDWYYEENGAASAPLTEAALRELIREGRLGPGVRVWHVSLGDWKAVRDTSLGGELPAVAPPPPPDPIGFPAMAAAPTPPAGSANAYPPSQGFAMNTPPQSPTSSDSGLPANVAGALSYLLGALTGILFLVIEKRDPFVRFHAAQAIGVTIAWIILSVAFMVLTTILAFIPVLGWILGLVFSLVSLVVSLGGLILWLFLMFQAFSGKEWEVPYVGRMARKTILGGS